MVFYPPKRLGILVGLIVLACLVGLQALLVSGVMRQEPSLGMFFTALLAMPSLAVLGLWSFWFVELAALRYVLDRNALVIEYGSARHTVPLPKIDRVYAGSELEPVLPLRGVGWPGFLKGRQRLPNGTTLYLHSTEPLERLLVIETPTASYGISPPSSRAFLDALAARQALGPVRTVTQKVVRSPFLSRPFWRDRALWAAIAAGIVLNIALFGLVLARYPTLGQRIALHVDAAGRPDRIASKVWLLVIPAMGTGIIALDFALAVALYRAERLASYLLAAVGAAAQAVLLLALVGITGRY